MSAGDSTRVVETEVVETEVVETEFYGIPVESRTLPAALYGWILAYANKALENIVQKTYKHYGSVALALNFFLYSLLATALSRIPQHSQNILSVIK